MIGTITIIGMGLIGSSIARNIKEKNLAQKLIAADLSKDVCDTVSRLGLADIVTYDFETAVKEADVVILCVPVGVMGGVTKTIAPFMKDGAILTDTGSTKKSVIEAIKPFCTRRFDFIPAHPIAGTQFSGPEAGFSELFNDRWCILTPLPESSIKSVEVITSLWESFGARVEIMDAHRHDLVLGMTSHIPHLLAFALMGTAGDLENEMKADVITYSATSFRDFTRVAASDPVMWRDIFLNNKDAVLELLDMFKSNINTLESAIRDGDGQALHNTFEKMQALRKLL